MDDMGLAFNEEMAAGLLQQGNMEAFDHYYHKYHQPIYANILKIVHLAPGCRGYPARCLPGFLGKQGTAFEAGIGQRLAFCSEL